MSKQNDFKRLNGNNKRIKKREITADDNNIELRMINEKLNEHSILLENLMRRIKPSSPIDRLVENYYTCKDIFFKVTAVVVVGGLIWKVYSEKKSDFKNV
ncbi:hypothetical protein ACF0H5_017753 [Mactra antiquata]